jgi:predicted ATP-grasp superfamily ATP-dependent carboligase
VALLVRPNLVVLLGPSVRAFARSAVAAGFRVIAVDDYCDLDLLAICEQAHRSPTDAGGFDRLLTEANPVAWSYGGGWENKPALVRRLTQVAPLWGTDADALAILRDPILWTEALREAGFLLPETIAHSSAPASDRRWLSKSAISAGGAHVCFAQSTGILLQDDASSERRFLQEFVPGEVESAAFVAHSDGVHFLGACRQIVGAEELGASGFLFAGAVGPLVLSDEEQAFFTRLGRAVAALAPIRGLFGVDGIRRADGRWLPIEINPRYTASMETLERARGRSFFADHAAACGHRSATPPVGLAPSPATDPSFDLRATNVATLGDPVVIGKAILYAQAELRLSFDLRGWRDFQQQFPGVTLADLPQPGTVSRPGEPVLTLLLAARSPAAARSALLSSGRDLHAALHHRFGSFCRSGTA